MAFSFNSGEQQFNQNQYQYNQPRQDYGYNNPAELTESSLELVCGGRSRSRSQRYKDSQTWGNVGMACTIVGFVLCATPLWPVGAGLVYMGLCVGLASAGGMIVNA